MQDVLPNRGSYLRCCHCLTPASAWASPKSRHRAARGRRVAGTGCPSCDSEATCPCNRPEAEPGTEPLRLALQRSPNTESGLSCPCVRLLLKERRDRTLGIRGCLITCADQQAPPWILPSRTETQEPCGDDEGSVQTPATSTRCRETPTSSVGVVIAIPVRGPCDQFFCARKS